MLKKIFYYIKGLFNPYFKIGLVSYYYPLDEDFANGVAVHTYYLSRSLAKKGCEVHVFTKRDKNYIKEEYIDKGKIVVHGINPDLKEKIKDPVIDKRMQYFIFDNKVINEITRENTEGKFDVIHTHGWLTAGVFISKYFNSIKWIHTFHAIEKNRLRFMTKEEKKFLILLNGLKALSIMQMRLYLYLNFSKKR